MRLLVALVFLAACGDDGIEIEGTPGVPFPAELEALIPYAAVNVESGGEQLLLFDSGSPITILDTSAVAGLQDGKHELDVTTLGITYRGAPVAAWNLPDGSLGTGLFGADLIRHHAFTIDYQGKRLWFSDEGHPGPRDAAVDAEVVLSAEVRGGGTAVLPGCAGSCGTLSFPATRLMMKATLEDQATPFWIIIDSGASGVVMTDELYATLPGAGRPRLDGLVVSTVDGARAAFLARVRRFALDGKAPVDDLPIIVIPGSDLLDALSREAGVTAKALVGGHYLRRFLTTLDYPGRALRLAPYRETSHIDPDEFVGVGFGLHREGDDWRVGEVYPGHDAYEEGIRPDDIIEEIGGMPVRGQPGEVVDAALEVPLGQEVAITYRHFGMTKTVMVMVEDLLPHYPAGP